MKKVIFDCDNTMGIDNRDIDDGLALLYLINNPDVELLGVTCTYGNEKLDYVYNQTVDLIKEIGADVDVYKGRGGYLMQDYYASKYENNTSMEKEEVKKNDAANFIVSMVNKYPGEVHVLATGSMQNILDAGIIDTSIIAHIKQVVLMGGITGPLEFGDKIMKELNFSVCPEGAFEVLTQYSNVSVLTGNRCMEIEFSFDELSDLKQKFTVENHNLKNEFVIKKIEKWMNEFKTEYNQDSIVLWDVIAAIYLTNPELFDDHFVGIKSKLSDFDSGFINIAEKIIENKRITSEDIFKMIEIQDNSFEEIRSNVISIPSALDASKINKKMIEIVHG
ncbi:MAG: nucleoside hydrolase [Peptostreptococcus sp.]|uniref:nucleoside hydrolase n=1 Tax=Peptostreptococcus sp. TaxID=1262 RepID=UPI002FC6576C